MLTIIWNFDNLKTSAEKGISVLLIFTKCISDTFRRDFCAFRTTFLSPPLQKNFPGFQITTQQPDKTNERVFQW